MAGSSLFDDNINGVLDENFDDIFRIFDFPLEDVEGNVGVEDWNVKFQALEQPSLDFLTSCSYGPSPKNGNDALKFANGNDAVKFPEVVNISTLHDETSPLKGLPVTVEATSSRSALLHKSSDVKGLRLFQTSSPVSVLESSSSCSVENPTTVDPKTTIPVKRARNKRPRPSKSNSQFRVPFFCSASSASKISHPSAAFESGSETSDLSETASNPSKKKMRKKKNLSVLSGATEMGSFSSEEPVATRKCMHCEVTKTPQWREGPMGPKTLCNACGVRFRSGRLFPEYRPAASPTFVSSLHSNSHKKVVEMRKKGSFGARMADMDTLSSSMPTVSTG